jgi:hypothetical protein
MLVDRAALPPNGTGIPLDRRTRTDMECRFGLPFADVRIHNGPAAAAAAERLNARAFTFGNNIVFGAGEYAPATPTGRRLLAHELVHVVQQRDALVASNRDRLCVGDPCDPLELEAEKVATELIGGGPISCIHADPSPAIRRVLTVDAASAVMAVDAGVSKAKPTVEFVGSGDSQIALAHLTQGINAAQVATAGAAGITDPVVKMTGKFDLIFDANDDTTAPGFLFGFIQVGKVFALQDTYVGRTQNEGHVILKHFANVSPTTLLDTVATFSPFSSKAGSGKSVKKGDKLVLGQTIDLGVLPGKTGDSPMSKSKAFLQNTETNAPNFLFEMKTDLEFTTVLVAMDPQKKVQQLAHVKWHLVWHFQFRWRGATNPVATVFPITRGADFGGVTKGPPADTAVAALVAAPKGPFFNTVTTTAKIKTALEKRPNRDDNFSRPAGVPQDFFT